MDAHICSICNHPYNSIAKKPLVLACSHSFCRACLQQVETAGDKRCPICRKEWSNVRLSDLPSCYQLIPGERQSVKGRLDEAASEGAPQQSLCVQHSDELVYWCESCDVPACEECMKLNHAECDYILMKDKVYITLLKDKRMHYSGQMLESKKELVNIRNLVQKLFFLENEKLKYQSKIGAWQAVTDMILANCKGTSWASFESPKQGSLVSDISSFLDELEERIPHRPSPLLAHIASAYHSSEDDVEAFTTGLRNRLEDSQSENALNEEALAGKVKEQAFHDDVATLTEKKEWFVSDTTSAAALTVVRTTGTRPTSVKVIWGDMPEALILEIQAFRNCEKHWTLDCFHNFGKPSFETRKSTSNKLKILIESDRCGSLKRFCGHLDEAAVQQLPATIRIVGMVLREEEDMAAVNKLCGVAFSDDKPSNGIDKLIWSCWTSLDLSVSKSFSPDYWKLSWKWYANNNGWSTQDISLSTALPSLGVRLRFHLPLLGTEDRCWMGDLFGVMALEGLRGPIPLFLPGANIDPDPLLGVLRDSGQLWEVHLPASLPTLAPRNEVTVRYKEDGHSVTWDLE